MDTELRNRHGDQSENTEPKRCEEDQQEETEKSQHSCWHCLFTTFLIGLLLFIMFFRFFVLPFLLDPNQGFVYRSYSNDDDENWVFPNDPEDEDDQGSQTFFQNDDGSIHIQMNGNGGSDIFGSLFGNIFGNNMINKEVVVSLKDVYLGTKRTEYIALSHVCSACNGRGMSGHYCPQCGGQGIVMTNMGFQHCPVCHGNGFIPEHQCPMCHGQGRINENVPFEMDIGRGIKDGFIFKKKYGNQLLQIRLRIEEHPVYKRDRNDLRITHTITLAESLFGFTHEMRHLDGHSYFITSNKILSDEDVLVIKNEGMPYYNNNRRFGNLYVLIKVQFPTSFTEEEKRVIQENLPDY